MLKPGGLPVPVPVPVLYQSVSAMLLDLVWIRVELECIQSAVRLSNDFRQTSELQNVNSETRLPKTTRFSTSAWESHVLTDYNYSNVEEQSGDEFALVLAHVIAVI